MHTKRRPTLVSNHPISRYHRDHIDRNNDGQFDLGDVLLSASLDEVKKFAASRETEVVTQSMLNGKLKGH